MSAGVITLRRPEPTVDQAWQAFRVAFIAAQAKPNIENMEKAVDAHRTFRRLFVTEGQES